MRKWRKMTWVLIIWSALIIIWMIAGSAGNDCANQAGDAFLSQKDAQSACEAGTGIGVALVALIGFFGFVFLSFIWFMTRPKTRSCPRCGEDVKKGVMTCKSCGYDFSTMGQPAPTAGPV
jgi:TM2 domain-containing membrane protein YozV